MSPIKIDLYESMAVTASARTGARELSRLREALEGKRPFGAQTRLLLVLARRGLVDLTELAATRAGRQP